MDNWLNQIHHGDCIEIMGQWPDECVDLIFADPPYNIGKAAWDKIDNYLGWCETWIAECSRVLKHNGAFWVIHKDARILGKLSDMIEKQGRQFINWVTWDKYNNADSSALWAMNKSKLNPNGKRSFDQDAEYLIYHADDGQWTSQCDKSHGFIFEPLRTYLDNERKRAGIDKGACNTVCGFSNNPGGMAARHYFSRSQWCLPTERHYLSLRRLFNNNNGGKYLRREYEDLHREYEDLRREYEHLRPTFNNPGRTSSVWPIPPAKKTWHPTPKPEELLRVIIETTSNPGDVIYEPFGGSVPACRVAQKLGRKWVATEIDQRYVELAREEVGQMALFV